MWSRSPRYSDKLLHAGNWCLFFDFFWILKKNGAHYLSNALFSKCLYHRTLNSPHVGESGNILLGDSGILGFGIRNTSQIYLRLESRTQISLPGIQNPRFLVIRYAQTRDTLASALITDNSWPSLFHSLTACLQIYSRVGLFTMERAARCFHCGRQWRKCNLGLQ